MVKKDDVEDLPKVPINAHTLREAGGLVGYLWPYRVKFALTLVLLFAGSLCGLAFPYLAGDLVRAARLQQAGTAGTAWNEDVNHVAVILIAVLAVQAGLAFWRAIWSVEVGERSLADLRRDTYTRLIRLPMPFHHSRRVGELTSRLSADLTNIHDMLIEGLPHFLRQIILMVGGVVLLMLTSLRLTLAMLLTVPVLMVVAVLFGNVIRRISREAQDRLAESNVVVEETLQNIATVKAFTNEPYEQGRYRTALEKYMHTAMRGGTYAGAFFAFIVLALFGSIVFVLWYGATLYIDGHIDEGGLTRFMLLTFFVGGAAGSFAELYSQFQRMLGSPLSLRGDVELRDVHFRYPSRPDAEVLAGVTLHVRPGERVALVGPSGAGKSTLVSLLLRFYDPQAGQVRIDGRPATEYDLDELRSRMALVPQDVLLFGGTIAENIAYGRPGAPREEIEEAARRANAHDFIAALPQGYETAVGERGVQLSGGQRQRIAIARAILRDPAVLLLDEATSSLDAESERLVLEALDRLMQGRTSIVIAHRLSTVRRADRIYVLKDGRVIESGNHDELMDRPEGVYRTLSLLQLEAPDRTVEEAWPLSLPQPG